MNKRILSLVLALVMVLGTFGTVFAASYDDVTGTDVATAVDRLSTLGILTGYPDGTFKPANSITRAEFAAVAARAKGLEAVAQAAKGLATGFNDVPASHWASGYVGTAAKLGIVNGMGFGQFVPEAPVKYEEAVTMIVRALGYEAAAQAKGGYPYGYLIVANENGLLDDVKGTQGQPATRGMVAQLTDNALEIPMMIQVGFGSDAKWVISGSKEHGDNAVEKYLLDELGFDSVKGRVVSVNTKTDKIIVDPTDEDLKNVTLEVAEGFDFYAVEGLETKFWYKNDTVVVYAVNEEAKFDAVKVDKDELVLIVEDENYEVARGATLTIDGEKVAQKDFVADYAKVVFNDDDEIIWAQGYTLDGFILVEEVKEEVAYSFDDYDELDLEDFTVVKEGKTIAIDAIEEEDIVFFNTDEEFAVVYNKGTEGELDRVYTDLTFRFEGKAYSQTSIGNAVALYFDEGKVGELNETVLDDFLDDELTITVFVDFAGKVVVVSGEVNSVGNSAYAVLTADAVVYAGRKGNMVALDVRNGANEKVSYDVLVADLGDDVKLAGDITAAQVQTLKKANNVVLKLTVDKDGELTGIELPESVVLKTDFDFDDANAKGTDDYSYKLQPGTIVFYDSNKKATTLGNAKDVFSEVKAGAILYIEKGRVVAVAGETDTDADTKDVTGLVTGVKRTTSGKAQFTIKVLGTTERLITKDNHSQVQVDNLDKDYANKIATLVVGETSGNIEEYELKVGTTITIDRVSGRTINNSVELNSKAVIYDAADKYETLNLRDLKVGAEITVYFQGSSRRFVDYVVVNGAPILPPVTTGVVTYINGTEFNVTLPSDAKATDTFIVKVGTDNATVVNGKANLTPATAWVNGTLKTAELYNIADLNKVLASHNFVVKAAVTATDFAAVSVVAGEIDVTMTTPATGRLVVTDSLGNEVYNSTTVVVTLDATDGLVQGATYTLKLMSGTEVLSTKTVKVMTAAEGSVAADVTAVANDKVTLTAASILNANTSLNNVTTGLTLGAGPLTNGSSVTWTSSNTTAVTTAGAVTRPAAGAADATVTLTAKIVKGDAEDTKVFTVIVKALPTPLQAVYVKATTGVLATTDLDAVTGLTYTAANIVAYDVAITALTAADVDTVAKLQAVINDVDADALVAAALGTVNSATAATMRAALEDLDLGLDLAAYNTQLGVTKDAVATSVFNARPVGGFADIDAVQAALDAAL